MRRTVRAHWSGNQSWAHALLGDSAAGGGGFLAAPFDDVWRRVQQGSLAEVEDVGKDLLQQLDSRVRKQKERLEKWDAFRAETFHPRPRQSAFEGNAHGEPNSAKGLDLNFVQHQHLQVQGLTVRPSSFDDGEEQPLTREYASLVNGPRDELTQIRSGRAAPKVSSARPDIQSPTAESQGFISEISDLEDDDDQPTRATAGPTLTKPNLRPPSPVASDRESSSLKATRTDLDAAQLYDHDMHVLDPISRKGLWGVSPRPSPAQQTAPSQEPPPMDSRARSPAQEAADQTLESMMNASPSPNKRTKPHPALSRSVHAPLPNAGRQYVSRGRRARISPSSPRSARGRRCSEPGNRGRWDASGPTRSRGPCESHPAEHGRL